MVIETPGEYQRECFEQYSLLTEKSGCFEVQYKPYHLIGLELGLSIASIICRGEPTGHTQTFAADVVARWVRSSTVKVASWYMAN